jgi:hypothetical protein
MPTHVCRTLCTAVQTTGVRPPGKMWSQLARSACGEGGRRPLNVHDHDNMLRAINMTSVPLQSVGKNKDPLHDHDEVHVI